MDSDMAARTDRQVEERVWWGVAHCCRELDPIGTRARVRRGGEACRQAGVGGVSGGRYACARGGRVARVGTGQGA
jgi:hypothetical protein